MTDAILEVAEIAQQAAALTVGPSGVLYGTTTYGGSGACIDATGPMFAQATAQPH